MLLEIPQAGDVEPDEEIAVPVEYIVQLRNDVFIIAQEDLEGVRTGSDLYPEA